MKKPRIFLIIIAVLIGILSLVVWWQFNNIQAVYYWWKYSGSDIEGMLGQNNSDIDKYINESSKYNVRPAKPVEEELHKKGVITDNELVDLLTEKTTVEKMFGTNLELNDDKKLTISQTGEHIDDEKAKELKENSAASGNETNTNQSEKEKEISECVAKVYVLKSTFVGQLDSLYSEAIASYKALPSKKREEGKQSIMSNLYPRAAALEKQCDTEMNAILSRLEVLLKETKSDTQLVTKIRDAYKNEKSLKKAYYLNKI